MSKTTKKKHVQKELLSREFSVPEDLNHIVRITNNSGNNLHQIVTHSGESYFVSMPGKFRNNIWIKPGDFVIVKPIGKLQLNFKFLIKWEMIFGLFWKKKKKNLWIVEDLFVRNWSKFRQVLLIDTFLIDNFSWLCCKRYVRERR